MDSILSIRESSEEESLKSKNSTNRLGSILYNTRGNNLRRTNSVFKGMSPSREGSPEGKIEVVQFDLPVNVSNNEIGGVGST